MGWKSVGGCTAADGALTIGNHEHDAGWRFARSHRSCQAQQNRKQREEHGGVVVNSSEPVVKKKS